MLREIKFQLCQVAGQGLDADKNQQLDNEHCQQTEDDTFCYHCSKWNHFFGEPTFMKTGEGSQGKLTPLLGSEKKQVRIRTKT